MKESVKAILTSILLRTLEVEPSLKVDEGVERALQIVPDIDLFTVDVKTVKQYLSEIGENFRQRAVINPYWLSSAKDVHFYFYLVNAQPGWLRYLVEQIKALETGISHYILYGVWDSLIVLCGTKDEAAELLKRTQSTTYYDLTHFSAHRIPFFHRHKTTFLKESIESHEPELINQLVKKYNTPDVESKKKELERTNVILGPAWTLDSFPVPRISAFVGISLKGGSHELHPNDVLETFLKNDTLKACLVHFFEVENGYPFHYFAKLVCRDMDELDKVTDVIGFTRIGRVGQEGNTFIIASGREEFPTLRSKKLISIRPTLDLRHVEDVANLAITGLGSDAISTFNNLDGTTQLIILRSLDELIQQVAKRLWDDERERSIRKAVDIFARSSLEGCEGVRLAGAVMEIATTVEGLVKHGLRRIVEAVYGRNYARAQEDLKLPTRDFRKISLGKAVFAFRTIKGHKDFDFLVLVLEDDWLDRLERFVDLRNTWAHGGVSTTLSGELVIDEARRTIVEAIELIRWIGGIVLPALAMAPIIEVRLPERRHERKFGIFLCHSEADKDISERIAVGLKALNYPVWYAEWAIRPSESIVQKINEGLARNDTLVILLSPNSVSSKWVQRELNTVLMTQLSGQNVTVVPLLIAECDIPTVLKDIKYIDMTRDYQTGFIKLCEFLKLRASEN